MTYTPEQLVHDMVAKMRQENLDWEKTDTGWTDRLKRSIRELLQSEDGQSSEVICSHKDTGTREFLLDIVVWERSDGEGVTLAVESEWGQHTADIEEDFWKLLVVKAQLKLMIFALTKKPRIHTQEAVWETLQGCLRKYKHHQKGERYIFLDFAPAPARKAWWIEIPCDGRLRAMPERVWIPV